MKNLLPLTLAIFTAAFVYGQNFEGKIVYRNTYKSHLPNVSDELFTSMMGSTQEYLIKGGNYLSRANGTVMQWQLYLNKDNKLYNKMSNSETVMWNDGSMNTDSVLKVEVNKSVTDILGYKCDEVILTCKSGIQKYYFSPKLGVDISLYSKHLYGNWYDYLKASKALPLKMTIENQQFVMESIATEVTSMKLSDKEFQLPANTKTAKSPY
jgi:hypothetical protein